MKNEQDRLSKEDWKELAFSLPVFHTISYFPNCFKKTVRNYKMSYFAVCLKCRLSQI